MRRLSYWVSTFFLGGLVLAFGGLLLAGNLAWAPAPAVIGPPPTDLQCETVTFESASGNRLSGWFIRGQPQKGSVLLMHGIRANRLATPANLTVRSSAPLPNQRSTNGELGQHICISSSDRWVTQHASPEVQKASAQTHSRVAKNR